MMMRLINEIAYQERLAKIQMEERTFRKAVEAAEDMPTIDAVPVVRCKDCKYFRTWDDMSSTCDFWTDSWDMPTDAEAFCSYAERKDGK